MGGLDVIAAPCSLRSAASPLPPSRLVAEPGPLRHTMAAAGTRRRKIIGRRRIEDEAEEDGGPEVLADLDDDSVTDGSIGSDEHDAADDSDTSNIDDASPTSPSARKPLGNGAAKARLLRSTGSEPVTSPISKPAEPAIADAETMLNKLSLPDKENEGDVMHFDDIKPAPPAKDAAPIVVSSSSASQQQPRLPQQELRRREHEEYRRRRDEDPTFVPNRGAFFLHDHRHAGPAANGFRPFPRGARGRGRGAFGSHFAPLSQMQQVPDSITNGVWKHDMHEAIAEPQPPRQTRYLANHNEGPPNGNGIITTAPTSKTPINRAMSTERHIGNATIRVYIPTVNLSKLFSGVPLKQYTKLPDHRPPLRSDKPVRISLPYHDPPVMPRYIFPASDRSFIFIPRAMRPNQQRGRGKGPRSMLGSGVFSRATSVWGGSVYGSVYSPSIGMSRRSSIAPEIGREFMLSPTGSAISRPAPPVDTVRPVVRLPPLAHPPVAPVPIPANAFVSEKPALAAESSISELPQPQTHPLPQKPTFQENRPNAIPMHQPRPQKTVSVENIESPVQQATNASPAYQQAFHQQVPPHLPNGFAQDAHVRNASMQSRFSSATPASQIPEGAIHAVPFQPSTYSQPGFYPAAPYSAMAPQQGFFYPPTYGTNVAPNANAPPFVPATQQGQPVAYTQPATQGEAAGAQPAAGQQGPPPPPPPPPSLVAQEINGMVYYYDTSQLAPPMPGFPPYPAAPAAAQPFGPGMVGGMGAAAHHPMMTPSPDTTFYYQQPPAPGMVYYPQ